MLHITFSSKGGAGIAALRLHEALCQEGIESGYLSTNLTINFSNESVKDDFFSYRKPTLLKKIINKIHKYFIFTNRQKIFKHFHIIKDELNCEIASLPFSVYKLYEHPLVKEADIINLHWLAGLIDYSDFFKKCEKPIVWTLHDMNPFQGLFHYKNDELRNFQIADNLDSKVKIVKKNAIKSIKKGTIIVPSKWLLNEVKKNNVFDHFDIKKISNGIKSENFKRNKTLLRKNYNIDPDEFIMLFVSDSLRNYRKGFDLLEEALFYIQDIKITLLVIGKDNIQPQKNLKILALGEINSTSKMADYYNLANVFILPSREDNLPNVMLESFASGTALIGFNVGGIAEHVIDGVTGVLAQEITGLSLANAVKKFYNERKNYDEITIQKYAENNFNYKEQASSYKNVYEKLL
ncbi:glycosyltransferase [Flavobacterium quisquiliarum]|uniref:Glycosyltransferase n=1 Tax=Flavobacterium quisquiliarum TaxID=1834436 RepID=A0ABV8WAQ3_9FLAO|nr:glycosyltransferase [Flavobacterium quisquiliarum]MBW1657716.1 glycosyltransferase [Flavobacterium quisquiliarum]